MDEFEFMLEDRIGKIQAIDKQYDLNKNAYISFSGGKDSTVLHYLIDMALPGNKIPRVFINTGIEYKFIREFVSSMAKQDNRIIILNSGVNIKKMLNQYGYPFKSKEHSKKVHEFNVGYNNKGLKRYLNRNEITRYSCPKVLLYQFEEKNKYNYSAECCQKLKKDIVHKYYGNKFSVLGIRKEEGGLRAHSHCTVFNSSGKLKSFNPLFVVTDEWIDEFIKRFNIQLCKLYYPPYNFKRTGCKGCPFALKLQEQLDIMEELLPNEYKQCEILWKPVYDEYRRLDYRLERNHNIKLW